METTNISDSTSTLQLLDSIFTSLATDPKPTNLPILISIDTEPGQRPINELGISTFDPYNLLSTPTSDIIDLNAKITTHCYAKGGSKSRYCFKTYRLGTATQFRNADVHHILTAHLQPMSNTDGSPRTIVLIGHRTSADISILHALTGLDISRASDVVAVLDTQVLSQTMFQMPQVMSLKRVLRAFELEYIGLHNAGHDSRYTLRALLMLYVAFKRSEQLELSAQMQEVLGMLERIARCHVTVCLPKRTRCASPRAKTVAVPDLFDRESDEDGDTVLLSLLE